MPPPAPPSPGRPPVPEEPSPYIANPEALKAGVVRDLEIVEEAWRLRSDASSSSTIPLPTESEPGPSTSTSNRSEVDVLHVLKVTTRAIRSVRNYLLALPDDHPTLHFGSNLIEAFRRHSISRPGLGGRRVASGIATPRPSTMSPGPTSSTAASAQAPVIGPAPPDPPSVIRRAALDVLSALRVLEERCRVPLSDEAYSTQPGILRAESPVSFALEENNRGGSALSAGEGSDIGHSSTALSSPTTLPSIPRSPKPDIVPLKVQGREKTVQVWADPEDDPWADFDDNVEKEDPWDERLVLGGGWLYRRDVEPTSLEKERSVVRRYLDVVDEVVFANSIPSTPGQRGWQRVKLDSGSNTRTSKSSRPSFDGSPRKSSENSSLRKRLISTTLLDAMSEVSMLTDEPEALNNSSLRVAGSGIYEQDKDIPDEELPDWAKRSSYKENPMGRLHSLIATHLPPELLEYLPSFPSLSENSDPFTVTPTSALTESRNAFREQLLTALSDGQILCTAYNLTVRKSRNPWGYIQLENVHDLLGLTHEPEREQPELDLSLGSSQRGKAKSSWTFRRTENLRYWAA